MGWSLGAGAGRGGTGRGMAGQRLGDDVAQEMASNQKVVQTTNAAVSVVTALNSWCGNDR